MKTFFQFTKHAVLCLLVMCTASSCATEFKTAVDLANITLQDTLNDSKIALCYCTAYESINNELKGLTLEQINTLTNSITKYQHTPNTIISIKNSTAQTWNTFFLADYNYINISKEKALFPITIELLNRLKDTNDNLDGFKDPLETSIRFLTDNNQSYMNDAFQIIYLNFKNQTDQQELAEKFIKIFPHPKNTKCSFVDLAGKSLQDEKFRKSPEELFCYFYTYAANAISNVLLNLLEEEKIKQIKETIEQYTLEENTCIYIVNSKSMLPWRVDAVQAQGFKEKKEKIINTFNKVLENKNPNKEVEENKEGQAITPKEPLKKQDEVFNYTPWAVVATGGVTLVGSYLWYRYRSSKELPFLPWKKTNKNNAKLFAFAQQKKLA